MTPCRSSCVGACPSRRAEESRPGQRKDSCAASVPRYAAAPVGAIDEAARERSVQAMKGGGGGDGIVLRAAEPLVTQEIDNELLFTHDAILSVQAAETGGEAAEPRRGAYGMVIPKA